MVTFPSRKFQVFVSSTYEDLKEERQAAVQAILSAGHIPAGMELFTAGDEAQMEAIKQWIDECDIYLLILGGRYGSIHAESRKSYIHLEYEYAQEKKKPLFSCVLKNPDDRVRQRGVEYTERINFKEYQEFRNLVTSKLVKFWDNNDQLQLIITQTLQELSRRDDLIGWIKADNQVNLVDMANEITRLSKENQNLKDRNQSLEDRLNSLPSSQSSLVVNYSDLKSVLLNEKVKKKGQETIDFLNTQTDGLTYFMDLTEYIKSQNGDPCKPIWIKFLRGASHLCNE